MITLCILVHYCKTVCRKSVYLLTLFVTGQTNVLWQTLFELVGLTNVHLAHCNLYYIEITIVSHDGSSDVWYYRYYMKVFYCVNASWQTLLVSLPCWYW